MSHLRSYWYPYLILLILFCILLLIPANRSIANSSSQTDRSLALISQETRALQQELVRLQTEYCETRYLRLCQDLSESELLLKEVRGELAAIVASRTAATANNLAWLRTRLFDVEKTIRTTEAAIQP